MRILTYFGVSLPAWKEEKMGAGQTTIRFVLKGTVISKKNNQMAVVKRKDAIDYLLRMDRNGLVTTEVAMEAVRMVKAKMIGNVKYNRFLKRHKSSIEAQKAFWIDRLKEKGLKKFPIPKASMTLRMYFKYQYITDTVNKQQTVQD
ncbi:MAG TPA: hypothetical protein VK616_18365, partial [Flavitalea sp.]|nr:hypothetical protein [Flavitalea sp.]